MNTSFMVIPEKTCSLLRSSFNCNFSLYSPRMISWEREHGDGKVQFYSGEEIDGYDKNGKPKWKKVNDDAKEKLCKAGNKLLKNSVDLLDKKHKKQKSFITAMKEQGLKTFELTAKLTSPFITGLGSGHPTETGMILDRNIGVPYIPASSIKGVMRLACAINIAKTNGVNFVNENDELLKQYFGSVTQNEKQQKRGELVFLDAYPLSVPDLKLDIMNPHFTKYYESKKKEDGKDNENYKQPVETESPVPIKFLSVATGTIFVFRCVYLPLEEKTCDENFVHQIFTTAFEQVGFGGKTSIGYGRFSVMSEDEIKKSLPLHQETKIHTENVKIKTNAIKNGEKYKAVICGKTKKGKWQVEFSDVSEYKGIVLNSEAIPEAKEGLEITVLVKAFIEAGSNVEYVKE